MSSTIGTVRSAWPAARAGGLLADAAPLQRPGLVPLPGGLAADPELEQDGAGPVDALIEVGRPADPGRVAVRAHDPGRHRPDRREPALVRIDQGQFGDLERPVSRATPSTSSGV
jgi:hypothetical protein